MSDPKIEPGSPAFMRGDAIGYEVGKTYLEQRSARPELRKLARRLYRDGQRLADALGFDVNEPGAVVAALLCSVTESQKTGEP